MYALITRVRSRTIATTEAISFAVALVTAELLTLLAHPDRFSTLSRERATG